MNKHALQLAGKPLPRRFFARDPVRVARGLLGKRLVRAVGRQVATGVIVETEAYAGIIDKASHAYNSRRTKRTEIMYGVGGISYVYLIYGIYSLFNVVTNKKGIPHAVLIRAIEPADGIEIMYFSVISLFEKANRTSEFEYMFDVFIFFPFYFDDQLVQ